MELFLIYIWLKLDSVSNFITVFTVLTVLAGVCWLFVFGVSNPIFSSERPEYIQIHKTVFNKYGRPVAIVAVVLTCLNLVLPSSKEVAILVGASIALDLSRSPEAAKVSTILRGKANELLDAEIQKLQKVK